MILELMSQNQYRLGPARAPRALKILVLSTFIVSLVAALCNNFQQTLGVATPEQILGLSPWGIDRFFLWQFFTYLFVHPVAQGISFSFLISLGFSVYLLWVIGTSIIERRGIASFFTLYFSSGILIGLIIYWIQSMVHATVPYAGNTASLYAILVAWIMLYPEAQLLFLLALPLKAKWLILSILAANLLIDLSVGEWLNTVIYTSGALFGYFYGLILWKVNGPFAALRPFEEKFMKLFGGSATTRAARFQTQNSRAKIYDFKTGRAILTDEEFLEEMLSKISLHGKSSLTWGERFRLRRISKRKKSGK